MRTTNLPARAFYRTLGFEDAGVVAGYYRGVETAVKMGRDIRRIAPKPVIRDKG